MTAKLDWGIIGTGFIAEKFAGELLQAPGAGLAAVGSRTLESAERFCSEYGGRPLGSYDELLADENVQIVYLVVDWEAYMKFAKFEILRNL